MLFNSIQKTLDLYGHTHSKQPRSMVCTNTYEYPCLNWMRNRNIGEKMESKRLIKYNSMYDSYCDNKKSKISRINDQIQKNTINFVKRRKFSYRNASDDDENSQYSYKTKRDRSSNQYSTASTKRVKLMKLEDYQCNNQPNFYSPLCRELYNDDLTTKLQIKQRPLERDSQNNKERKLDKTKKLNISYANKSPQIKKPATYRQKSPESKTKNNKPEHKPTDLLKQQNSLLTITSKQSEIIVSFFLLGIGLLLIAIQAVK